MDCKIFSYRTAEAQWNLEFWRSPSEVDFFSYKSIWKAEIILLISVVNTQISVWYERKQDIDYGTYMENDVMFSNLRLNNYTDI